MGPPAAPAMVRGSGRNPRCSRMPSWVPSVASLYSATALRQENAYFSIGERCNANGSKKWRELQAVNDWDGCIAMGREKASGIAPAAIILPSATILRRIPPADPASGGKSGSKEQPTPWLMER